LAHHPLSLHDALPISQKGQLVMINWGPDYPDPGANVNPFTDYKAKSIAYRNGWDDATIAQKAHDAELTTDPGKRVAAYKDIGERSEEHTSELQSPYEL